MRYKYLFLFVQAVVARANNLKNSGVPDDIFQLDDLSVLVHDFLLLSRARRTARQATWPTI